MNDDEINLFLSVDPKAYNRIDRVRFAVELLEKNVADSEVQNRIQRKFDCSRMTAWRTLDIARDIAGGNNDS